MRMVVVCSLTGAPGVTTTALALALREPIDDGREPDPAIPEPMRVLVEADPSGGDIAAWLGLSDTPGLLDLAAATRRSSSLQELLAAGGQALVAGARGVLAPAGAAQTRAALALMERGGFTSLRAANVPGTLIIDVGRLGKASRSLATQADATMLLCRGGVDALSHVAAEVDEVAQWPCLYLVVVGACSHSLTEVSETLGIARVHSLPWDPQVATEIQRGITAPRGLRRRRLPAAIESLGTAIQELPNGSDHQSPQVTAERTDTT